MKKIIIISLLVIGCALTLKTSLIIAPNYQVYASEKSEQTQQLENTLKNEIESLDLQGLEDYYEELNLNEIFTETSLKELVYKLITGEQKINNEVLLGIFKTAVTQSLNNIINIVTIIILIVAASRLSNILTSNNSTSSIVNYMVLLVILSIISGVVTSSLNGTIESIQKVKSVIETLSPILLSFLVLIGASGASSVYGPLLVVLAGAVVEIVLYVLLSVITIYFVLSIISAITDQIKLDKFRSFLVSFFKYTIGFIFTIFIGYLSITGITSSTKDGISIKTAKYAIRSYLPLVGGYISDSYELFRAGSVLMKNSIGTIGVIIIFSVVIIKVISLLIYNLGFKFAGAVIEPMGENKISNFIASLSVVFNFLLVTIIAVFMMCFITLLVIISTANVV